MYISPFLAGVLSVIVLEMAIVVGLVIYYGTKK